MTIDWASFTPGHALAGGALIGLAASVLVLFNGRIAGISGVVGGLLHPARADFAWRVAFVTGLLCAGSIYALVASATPLHVDSTTSVLVVAGLLVGFGTRLGSGCTSGHGVCGMARLSGRSAIATLVFMMVGFGTVYVTRHVLNV